MLNRKIRSSIKTKKQNAKKTFSIVHLKKLLITRQEYLKIPVEYLRF